ncbi:MAG TPA: LPS export ABC transporter periplasmic protein LptC [Chthoniobacter sp.]|jgi:hypothetical protein
MSLFAKSVAVLCASLIVATAPFASADNGKAKKAKTPKTDETPAPKKHYDIPVIPGHPASGLTVPYFSSDGKRQMNFKIGVATRTGDNKVNLQNMHIETFNEHEEHEMAIELPNSDYNTETNVITTRHHVKINRDDFELTGDAMIFNTVTKQGGLSGNVHMIIYDMKSKTGRSDDDADSHS